VLAGVLGGKVTLTPLAEVVAGKKPLDEQLLNLAPVLAK
jgi:hypothetical protein